MLVPIIKKYADRGIAYLKSALRVALMRTAMFIVICGALAFGIFTLIHAHSAPVYDTYYEDNPLIITIPSGTGTRAIAELLKNENIIRSERMFLLRVSMTNATLQAGVYNFSEPLPLGEVVDRIDRGIGGDVYNRLRIREGAMRRDIAEDIAPYIADFDKETFMQLTHDLEGYLFPETYFILPGTTMEEFINRARNQFDAQIASIQDDIDASPYTLEDIVIMASIIEKEATNDFTEQQMISGILWKRIEIGMLLQVDAPFMYTIGKGSAQLTRSDLAMDSPYNTYRYTGLPPTAIGSPSLSALRAAATPIESPYLFYLHGNDGIVRYGRNFDEHILNRQRHLRLR